MSIEEIVKQIEWTESSFVNGVEHKVWSDKEGKQHEWTQEIEDYIFQQNVAKAKAWREEMESKGLAITKLENLPTSVDLNLEIQIAKDKEDELGVWIAEENRDRAYGEYR